MCCSYVCSPSPQSASTLPYLSRSTLPRPLLPVVDSARLSCHLHRKKPSSPTCPCPPLTPSLLLPPEPSHARHRDLQFDTVKVPLLLPPPKSCPRRSREKTLWTGHLRLPVSQRLTTSLLNASFPQLRSPARGWNTSSTMSKSLTGAGPEKRVREQKSAGSGGGPDCGRSYRRWVNSTTHRHLPLACETRDERVLARLPLCERPLNRCVLLQTPSEAGYLLSRYALEPMLTPLH